MGVDLPVGDGLELLHQLHHLVVVLDLSAVQIKVLTSSAQGAWEVKLPALLWEDCDRPTTGGQKIFIDFQMRSDSITDRFPYVSRPSVLVHF